MYGVGKEMHEKHLILFTIQTFRQLLASYAMLLMLPLFVSIFLYTNVATVVSREISRANRASLLQVKRIVDGKINELYILADQLSLNEKIQRTASAPLPVSASQRLLMGDAQKLLREAKLVNSFINEIYLYCPKSGYILSNITRYTKNNFAGIAKEKFGMTLKEWEDTVLGKGYRNLHIIYGEDKPSKKTFMFTQKLMYNGFVNTSAVLIIVIDQNQFSELLETMKWNNEGQLIIAAPDGRHITHPNIELVSSLIERGEADKEKMTSKIRDNGQDFFVDSIYSDKSNIQYTYMIPSNEYLQSLGLIKRFMYFYAFVCLIAGMILSFCLARKNYTPIYRVIRIFLDKLGQTKTQDRNVAVFLEETLQGLFQKNEDLSKTILRQKKTVRNNLLSKLLQGDVAEPEVLIESCKACGVQFMSEYTMLMGVVISEDSTPFFEDNSVIDMETKDLIQFMIQSVLEELTGEEHAGYVLEVKGITMCFVTVSTIPGKDPGWKQTSYGMMKIAERTQKFFAEEFGIYLSFGISNIFDSFSKLPKAVAEVCEIVDCITLYGEKNTIIHACSLDVEEEMVPRLDSSLSLLHKITASIQMMDFRAAKEEFNRFVEIKLLGNDVHRQVARLRMTGLVSILLEAFLEMRSVVSEESLKELNLIGRLTSIKSVQDLQEEVQVIFRQLDEQLHVQTGKSGIDKQKIMEYVEEHFNDYDLNVNYIAEKFGISTSQLSRSFKKETGVGLLHYIHLYRLKEAKRLIEESNMSIHDIALEVGYGSRMTLVRAFKRYEGKPPSAFRE